MNMRRAAVVSLACIALLLPFFNPPKTKVVLINGVAYQLEIAHDAVAREKGLSGRVEMKPYSAMLFVFDADEKWQFWMKDMHFSIDIVWLDKAKKINHIERVVPPESYPKTFQSPQPARYVLELPMHGADSLKVGDSLSF